MVKYSKTITLETIDPYHPIKFTVVECDTQQDADAELTKWVNDYPEIFENENNVKILRMVLNGK